MNSEFERYVPKSGAKSSKQQNVRIRDEDREDLEIIAAFEGDNRILPLVYEGVGRVIESRFQDPEWLQKAAEYFRDQSDHYSRRAEEHIAKLAEN